MNKAEHARELFKEALISYQNIDSALKELENRKIRYQAAKKALEGFLNQTFDDGWFTEES